MSLPERIGRLRPVARAGAGGFATVWRARDDELDADVAIKVLAENWAARADVRERFIAEARLLRRVDADGIVRVYDIGELADGRPWFAMTYADRGSLGERLPWRGGDAAALDILEQVAVALARLHSRGIVHRDVTPGNILFVSDPDDASGERVLLADLGLAKDVSFASGLTEPAGTGRYRAPEQRAYGSDIGPATDVYAVAMVAQDVLGEDPRTRDLVEPALVTDPAVRLSDPRDLVARLREAEFVPGPTEETPAASLAAPARQGRGWPAVGVRNRPRRWALLAVLLLVSAAGGMALRDRGSTLSAPDGTRLTLPGGGWEQAAYTPTVQPGLRGTQATRPGWRVALASGSGTTVAGTLDSLAGAMWHTECTRHARREVTAGELTGVVHDWSDCPDSRVVHEVGLARAPAQQVLLSVSGPAGQVDLEKLLRGLEPAENTPKSS